MVAGTTTTLEQLLNFAPGPVIHFKSPALFIGIIPLIKQFKMETHLRHPCKIFYHASHEQFSPRELLAFARLAEQAGFDGCHASDHFHPWSKRQGQSGHVYCWLGALMEATKFDASFITTPGQRYHPAVVAQAIATLGQMYPGRLTVELGSGEALNEHITGAPWPGKAERDQRLWESASVIRRLLTGEKVNHQGLITVQDAKLYTLPDIIPPLTCAGLIPATARWAGEWADGFITVHKPKEKLREIIAAFREGGGSDKPVSVKITFSYARDERVARQQAYEQWRTNCIESAAMGALGSTEEFDQAGENISLDTVLRKVPVSSRLSEFAALIQETIDLGVSTIVLHNVNRMQEEFITDFGLEVIPAIQRY